MAGCDPSRRGVRSSGRMRGHVKATPSRIMIEARGVGEGPTGEGAQIACFLVRTGFAGDFAGN